MSMRATCSNLRLRPQVVGSIPSVRIMNTLTHGRASHTSNELRWLGADAKLVMQSSRVWSHRGRTCQLGKSFYTAGPQIMYTTSVVNITSGLAAHVTANRFSPPSACRTEGPSHSHARLHGVAACRKSTPLLYVYVGSMYWDVGLVVLPAACQGKCLSVDGPGLWNMVRRTKQSARRVPVQPHLGVPRQQHSGLCICGVSTRGQNRPPDL
eukprot:351978-Chlamydomonas_euryale.AAC.4